MNGYENPVNVVQSLPVPEAGPVYKQRPSNRVQIHNLPAGFTSEGIDLVLNGCGTVKKASLINAEAGPFVSVIFKTSEDAQKAVAELNEREYEGSNLRVEVVNNSVNNRSSNKGGAGGTEAGRSRNGPQQQGGSNRGAGFPLRILVPSEYVGAIIGRKGQTIRSITTRCKARVDVHGKENSGLIEKVISVFGHPENCTSACKEILLVMQQEASINNRGEILLKMLTDDRYCGRIIGKEGKIIKKIRDDTGTKITVSNTQELAAMYPDRVIAIRGPVDGMAQAEAAISAKLSECLEYEIQQANMRGTMAPMGSNASYYPNNRQPYEGGWQGGQQQQGGYYSQQMYPPQMGVSQQSMMSPVVGGGAPAPEMCQIGVPNAAVGAIIGTAGSNIKQIMRDSGAFVNIEAKKEEDPAVERLVSIRGNTDACWRASYMVFEKMKLEGFGGNEEVRLRTIIKIKKVAVGRIIGKSGKTVRELQRATGAMIRLPEDPSVQGEEVTVEVYGNFMSTQSAQGRIRALASQSTSQFNNGGEPYRARSEPRRVGPRRPSQGPQLDGPN